MTQTDRALILLFLSSSSALAAGGNFSTADLRPLLRVHSSLSTVQHPDSPFPIGLGEFDNQFFISKGGGTVRVAVEQSGLSGDLDGKIGNPFRTRIVRGVSSKADLASLKSELTAAKIGARTTCSLSGVVEPHVTTGIYEITWYGQGDRRNHFTVELFGLEATPSHPLCPPSVSRLLGTIATFLLRVEEEPGSEILESVVR